MARALSFCSSAIAAICSCGLPGPPASGTSAAARSNACIASSFCLALRAAVPSAICTGKLRGFASAIGLTAASGIFISSSTPSGTAIARRIVPNVFSIIWSKPLCIRSRSMLNDALSAPSVSTPVAKARTSLRSPASPYSLTMCSISSEAS